MHSDQKKAEKNTPPPKPPSWVTVKLKPGAAIGKLSKLQFFPKKFTKMDFFTPKCAPNLLKHFT